MKGRGNYLIALFFIVLCGLTACSKDDDKSDILPYIIINNDSISSNEVNLSSEENTFVVKFETNAVWDISISENWCTTEFVHGEAGNQELLFKFEKNETTKVRYVIVLITAKSLTKQIIFKQNGVGIIDIPDVKLKGYLKIYYDNDGDGQISEIEAQKIEDIDCRNLSVKSLKGIEFFPNLKRLSCGGNSLGSIDVSKNKKLEFLQCPNCNIVLLDVSQNTQLTYLDCSMNSFETSLNIENNKNLKTLYCSMTGIKSLDLSYCNKLDTLICTSNPLTSLNVESCKSLIYLDCSGCSIIEINGISECKSLELLYCPRNQITKLDLENLNMLKDLSCVDNPISNINLKGKKNLQKVDLSSMPTLKYLDLSETSIQTIGYYYAEPFSYAVVDINNNIENINVSGCKDLISVTIINDRRGEDGLPQNGVLEILDCSDCEKLETIRCNYQNLIKLDIEGCTSLKYLFCANNKLESIDVTSCSLLERLECNQNQILELNLRNNTLLQNLYCSNNPIESLDISSNPDLCNLSYEIEKMPRLKTIYIRRGQEELFSSDQLERLIVIYK